MTETTFLVLLALYEPNHGYGIMQFIEKETKGRVVLGAGTLYGAIHTLEKKNWIVQLCEETDRKKKMYVITELGKEKAEAELKREREVMRLAGKVISREKHGTS